MTTINSKAGRFAFYKKGGKNHDQAKQINICGLILLGLVLFFGRCFFGYSGN